MDQGASSNTFVASQATSMATDSDGESDAELRPHDMTQIEKLHHQKDANMMKTTLLWGSLVLVLVHLLGHSVLYVQKYYLTT